MVYHSWCRENARRAETVRVQAPVPAAGAYYAPHVATYASSPAYSRGSSLSPPELTYDGSSASSTSSRPSSRATTPGSAVSIEHAARLHPVALVRVSEGAQEEAPAVRDCAGAGCSQGGAE